MLAELLLGMVPALGVHAVAFGAAGHPPLLLSRFVLGGDSWDKLRTMFIRGAGTNIPGKASAGQPGCSDPARKQRR